MTPAETQLFELLDTYSRTLHKCFLAEMFLDKSGSEYVLCFRPVSVSKGSLGQYASRYLRIEAAHAQTVGQAGALSTAIKEKLDRELPPIGQSPD
jgi:hypothetical protein